MNKCIATKKLRHHKKQIEYFKPAYQEKVNHVKKG